MANVLPAGYALPRPQTPKTIGVLNIVFGSIALLASCCQDGSTLGFTYGYRYFQGFVDAQQKSLQAKQEARQKARLDEIAEAEKKATTEAEKAEVARQRAAVPGQPVAVAVEMTPDLPFEAMGYRDPRVAGYYVNNLIGALILDTWMIVAGIGLLRLSERARRQGIWVAGLKIGWLTACLLWAVLVVVPFTTRKMFATAQEAGPAGAPAGPGLSKQAAEAATMMGAVATGQAVGVFVFSAIYPSIALWALTRPGTRAACLARQRAAEAKPEGRVEEVG